MKLDIPDVNDCFASPAPAAGRWPGLERAATPPIHAFADYVHGCSPNPADRTVAITVLVASCCQLAGSHLTRRMPSLMLVAARGRENDQEDNTEDDRIDDPADGQDDDTEDNPADDPAERWVAGDRNSPPGIYPDGAFALRKPEAASDAMAHAVIRKNGINPGAVFQAEVQRTLEDLYFDACRSGFGSGPSRPYAGAWHDDFGLLSDRNGRVILRLRSRRDAEAFHRDVVARSGRLLAPQGIGEGLEWVAKQFGVSGTLGTDLWDAGFAQAMVNLPLPAMVMPRPPGSPLKPPDGSLVLALTDTLHRAFDGPLPEHDNFVPGEWFAHYAGQLRQRLRHLPGDYEHAMQRHARQLFPACLRLAGFAGRVGSTSHREVEALALDLCAHALRGMTIATAGLAWHGLGFAFDGGCPRGEFLRALDYLRRKGPMTAAEFLRKAHLANNKLRDALVERFLEEDLARLDGKQLRATTFAEFAAALHARKEFPHPINHWAEAAKESAATAP